MVQNDPKLLGLSRGGLVVLLVLAISLATIIVANASGGVEANQVGEMFSYISPRPDAEVVSAGTTIALRAAGGSGAELIKNISITVFGKQSGRHLGRTKIADDQQTIIFEPEEPFQPDEMVLVTIDSGDFFWEKGLSGKATYQFHVNAPVPVIDIDDHRPENLKQTLPTDPTGVITTGLYVTAPPDFPTIVISTTNSTISDSYIFLSYLNYYQWNGTQAYQLILDNAGEPVYYNRLNPTFDFKRQPNGLLTYFDASPEERRYLAKDSNYNLVDTYEAGNGYSTDNHDLKLLDNGHALLMARNQRIVDMSKIVPGGDPQAIVIGCLVQEIDGDDNVIFEWSSWDHIPITNTNQVLTRTIINYMHCNAVDLDQDGNVLLNSRHLDEVTKIDRQSGDIIWRLGGKENQFTFTNDGGFFFQHDAHRLPNGNLTLFDNRTDILPLYSRIVEYALDEQNMTATLVEEYRNTPDTYGPYMGNSQLLPNGNRVIGWGASSEPLMTEITAVGDKVFEMSTSFPNGSYRVFRFPWEGHPPWPPVLIPRKHDSFIRLHFSWNGATDLNSYKVFGNPGLLPLSELAIVSKDGFETTFDYYPESDGLHSFQVIPIEENPGQLARSNLVYVLVGGGPQNYLPIAYHE